MNAVRTPGVEPCPGLIRQVGLLALFGAEEGLSSISQPGEGADVFVHHTNVQMNVFRSFEEGQAVEFDLEEGPKGLQAVDVRLAQAA